MAKNPVRLAKISDFKMNPCDHAYDWFRYVKNNDMTFEVAPAEGICCSCYHFVPPEETEKLLSDSTWGIKGHTFCYVE